ncbi:conserved hypothetical protein [Ricinus communis]|uniref:Uncharacterized protein n=1 Tax=Ricinus communis TaxID=3988 RepID=B9T8S8_RICCO|nr:conserved hypothetical protein [Ricinus communis]
MDARQFRAAEEWHRGRAISRAHPELSVRRERAGCAAAAHQFQLDALPRAGRLPLVDGCRGWTAQALARVEAAGVVYAACGERRRELLGRIGCGERAARGQCKRLRGSEVRVGCAAGHRAVAIRVGCQPDLQRPNRHREQYVPVHAECYRVQRPEIDGVGHGHRHGTPAGGSRRDADCRSDGSGGNDRHAHRAGYGRARAHLYVDAKQRAFAAIQAAERQRDHDGRSRVTGRTNHQRRARLHRGGSRHRHARDIRTRDGDHHVYARARYRHDHRRRIPDIEAASRHHGDVVGGQSQSRAAPAAVSDDVGRAVRSGLDGQYVHQQRRRELHAHAGRCSAAWTRRAARRHVESRRQQSTQAIDTNPQLSRTSDNPSPINH